MEDLLFPVSSEKPNETKHNAPVTPPVSKSTSKPANAAKWEVILKKGPSKKSSPSQLQVQKRCNGTNKRKPFFVQRTRGSRNEEIRAKHNQRLMLRLDSERGDTPQTYTKMAAKQQAVNRKKAHETRQGRKVLQPNRVLKEMNGKVVQCNNQNTKVKVIFVEYDDSTISSYDGGSDESYASGSYYTSDLAYLNDKFDQWLDRIAGIPDKRKRRSKY